MREDSSITRRNALEATAALGVGVAGLAGTATAECYDVAVLAPAAEVYDECNGDAIGYVRETTTGETCKSCTDASGDTWWYCDWDYATPDGWVHESYIYVS